MRHDSTDRERIKRSRSPRVKLEAAQASDEKGWAHDIAIICRTAVSAIGGGIAFPNPFVATVTPTSLGIVYESGNPIPRASSRGVRYR